MIMVLISSLFPLLMAMDKTDTFQKIEDYIPFNSVARAESGPIGMWHLDEGEGNIIHDATVNGNNGSLKNMDGSCWVTGVKGKALMFDGIDDYIDIRDDDIYSIDTTGRLSVSFWLKTGTDITSKQMIMEKGGQTPNGPSEWAVLINEGCIRGLVAGSSGDNIRGEMASISENTWYYVCILFTGFTENDEVQIYLNGYKGNNIYSLQTRTYANLQDILAFGRGYSCSAWRYFNGIIDEVSIYDRGLSIDEVQPHFNKSSPVGIWHFNEGEGNLTYDATENGNNGTLKNMNNTNWVNGARGKALTFDGKGNHIDLVDDDVYSIDTTGKLSVSFWLKTSDDITNKQMVIEKGGPASTGPWEWMILINEGFIRGLTSDSSGDNIRGEKALISPNTWYSVCVIFTGYTENDEIQIYLNGHKSNSIYSCQPRNYSNTQGILTFGRGYSWSAWRYFKGILDEISIYSREMNESEIKAHCRTFVQPVGEWHLDEGKGNITCDACENGNDGTLMNMNESNWVNGVDGKALGFNGVDDYVSIMDNDAYSIDTTGKLSVSFYLKTGSNITSTQMIVAKGGQTPSGPWEWAVCIKNRSLRATTFHPLGDNIRGEKVMISENTWYSVCVIFTGYTKDDEIQIYLDGQKNNSIYSYQTRTYENTRGGLAIGRCYGWSSWRYFDGIVDEVVIYNRELNENEIQIPFGTFSPPINDDNGDDYNDEGNNPGDNTTETDASNPPSSDDMDGDGIPDSIDSDVDNDGWNNSIEIQAGTDHRNNLSFPPDLDGDLIPDVLDDDIDGDNTPNLSDAFPMDPTEWSDTDGDGIGDNTDDDIDGDTWNNTVEENSNTDLFDEQSHPVDSDSDGVPDHMDLDRDGDSILNSHDTYPDDKDRWSDDGNSNKDISLLKYILIVIIIVSLVGAFLCLILLNKKQNTEKS